MTIEKIKEIQNDIDSEIKSIRDVRTEGTTLGLLYVAMALFEIALNKAVSEEKTSWRSHGGELMAWFQEGVEKKATHMIVVVDTFDYEDYPAYVMEGEDVREREKQFQGNMQRVMEVYDLRKDMESQMKPGTRVFNY